MPEKELYLDGANALISVFAGAPISKVKLFEDLFHVKIIARDCRIKICSDNSVFTKQVYSIPKELNQIYEFGYSIRQKDLEFLLSKGHSNNIKDFYSESIKVSPRKNAIITGDPSQTDLSDSKPSGLEHAGKILKQIKEIAFQELASKNVVHNSLVEKIINAYDHDKSTKKSMSKSNKGKF